MSYTLSDFLNSRIHASVHPAPILQLWQLDLPDSTYLRFVDFMDRGQGTNPDRVLFNGAEFLARQVTLTEVVEGTDVIRSQLSVTVADPTHTGAFYLRQYNGLDNCNVTLWLTTYDRLDHPEDALTQTFRVISSVIVQSPPSVTLVLGMRNLVELMFPKLFYDRKRCFNSYQERFVPGALCNYPSNEFDASTAQDYLISSNSGVQQRKYGWLTQQATRAWIFRTNTSERLEIESRNEHAAWWNAARYGPYLFRQLSGDFDVHTYVHTLVTERSGWQAGLLIQDLAEAASDPELPPTAPTSSWLFWSVRDNGSGGQLLRRSQTVADVSTVGSTYAVTDRYLRVARVGSTFTLYSSSDGSAWTQREQVTDFTQIPTECRVGLVLCSGTYSTTRFGAQFEYIRFSAGGYATCKRSWEDCLVRLNTHRFNGFRQIPDDRIHS